MKYTGYIIDIYRYMMIPYYTYCNKVGFGSDINIRWWEMYILMKREKQNVLITWMIGCRFCNLIDQSSGRGNLKLSSDIVHRGSSLIIII